MRGRGQGCTLMYSNLFNSNMPVKTYWNWLSNAIKLYIMNYDHIGWGWACSLCHNLLQTCNYQFISFYSLQPQSFPNLYHSCQTCIVESKNWKMSANIWIQHNPAFGRIYKYRYSCLVIVLILQDKYWKKSCSGMHLLEQAVRISYPEGPLTCIVPHHSRQLCFVILNVFFSPCVPPSVFQ